MADLETLLTYLTLISVPIGIFYYIMTLNNTKKNQELTLETRQAQLFMELYREYRDPKFRKMYLEVSQWTWEDHEDFRRKYTPEGNIDNYTIYASVMSYFEGIGVLVKRGLIGIEMVYDLLALQIKGIWEKYASTVIISRKHLEMPTLWDDFEYLYNELMKYLEAHQELAI